MSENLLATVVKSFVGSAERPAASSDVGAGLKELGPNQAGTAGAGDSIMQGTGPAAGSNPCPDAGLPQECGPSLQHVSPRSSTPELKDALEMEAPSLAFEAEEALQIAAISSITGYEEEQGEMESVLPRATLQPIAEEPTCDSDSSSDTVGQGGDGDSAPTSTAAQGLVTAQPEGKQSQGISEPTPSPCSSGFNAVESPEHVGVKSSVSADDGSSLDKVPKMVKSFDAVVFAAETPSSPGLPAEGKVGPEPQPAVDVAAGLDGEADLRSSARKDVSQAIRGAKPATGMENRFL